jgi:phospho-N-acetylmuramoyl-pentapeptide-transferase
LLYWLLYQKLYPFFHPFRIFRYLTFRTAFASGTALLIALFIGPWVIQKLREFQIGQYVRGDGPQSHLKKSGTPTMGGVLIAIAILLPTVLWSDPANPFVWITVFSTLAFGAIGFADDYIKVVQRRSLGLTARAKLLWQGLAGAAVAIALVVMQQFKMFSTPGIPGFSALRCVCHFCPHGFIECREPDRRFGRSGHWLHHHRRRRAGSAHIRQRPRGVCRLP